MSDPAVPLAGSTLIVGPIRSGKTRLTAATLRRWLDRHGPDDVVVLDFAPEIETEDGLIGGRLDRFIELPDGVHATAIDAYGPRTEGSTDASALELAATNATRAKAAIASAPASPRAIFANDVTIVSQHKVDDIESLMTYCAEADCAVLNAYAGDAFEADDPITATDRAAVDRLRSWADRVIDLGDGS